MAVLAHKMTPDPFCVGRRGRNGKGVDCGNGIASCGSAAVDGVFYSIHAAHFPEGFADRDRPVAHAGAADTLPCLVDDGRLGRRRSVDVQPPVLAGVVVPVDVRLGAGPGRVDVGSRRPTGALSGRRDGGPASWQARLRQGAALRCLPFLARAHRVCVGDIAGSCCV